MDSNKIAFIFIGESFRSGNQGSRIIGDPKSYELQKNASKTHMDLITNIKNKYNYDSDIYISSVTTQYDTDLKSWYTPLINTSFVIQNKSSIHFHIRNAQQLVTDKNQYTHIFIFRIDLVFKEYMINILDPNKITKFTFPSICFMKSKSHKIKKTGLPRINDMFFLIPNKYYHLLEYTTINYQHDAWSDFITQKKATNADFDVLLDTYHDSDSHKDWNPIYYLYCRPEAKQWHTRGYIFNKETLEPEEKEVNY
jgi:hypothetical protein